MNVLLVKPWLDSFNWYHSHMLGLAYLAGFIRSKGHTVEILDASFLRIDEKGLASALRERRPDLIGITAMTHEIPRARKIAARARVLFPRTPIVIGGPHATARPAETVREIPELDYAVAGEGETPMQLLLEKLDGGDRDVSAVPGLAFRDGAQVVYTGPQKEFFDLTTAPGPAVDLYYGDGWFADHPKNEYRIYASRGCPFQCAYCMRVLGSRVRWRTTASVLEEWETAVRRYGARVVFFHDEIFLYDNPHSHAILDGVIGTGIQHHAVFNAMTHVRLVNEEILRKAKEANCYKICIGVESGNNEILKRVHRPYTIEEADAAVRTIKRHGIRPFTFFILGHPGETHRTIRDTIAAAVRINPFEMGMGIMVPYPGTEIYELAKAGKGGYRLTGADWDAYDRYGGHALAFERFSYRQLIGYQVIGYLLFFVLNGKFRGMFTYFAPKARAVLRILAGRRL